MNRLLARKREKGTGDHSTQRAQCLKTGWTKHCVFYANEDTEPDLKEQY